MSVTVKVLDAKQAIESHKVQNGQTLVLEAKNNVNYQLINDQTGYAPQNILTERDGNDLIIRLEEMDKGVSSGKDSSSDPAIIIKDYYAQDGVSNLVVGLHENGGLYAYVPESGQAVDAISALAQEVVKGQALGGTALGAAVWTFNPWWLAGILGVAAIAGIAAAAGGGSKGSAMASADKANINVDVDGTTAIEMPAGAAAMTVSYIPEGATSTLSLIVQKNADGSYSLINSNGEALSATEVQALDASGVHFDAATGNVTFDPNAVADGTEVKAVTREPGKLPAEAVATTPMVDGQADSAAIAQDALGNEVIAPGADNTSYKVTYTDEAGEVVTVDVVKNGDVWESVNPLPEGVILDPTSGVLTVPENAVMDGSTIDVVSNSGDKTPMNQQVTTPTQDSIADKPVITLSDGGQVSAMPGDDNNEMVANYTDEQGNPQSVKVVKQADGTWKAVDEDGNVIAAKDLPRGVDVDESNGAVTLAPNAVQDGSEIIAQGTSEGKNPTTVTEGPAAADSNISDEPIVSVDGTKGVEATPGADNDEMTVEYKDEDGNDKTVTVKKDPETGKWSPVLEEGEELPESVIVDEDNGTVSIDPNGLADPVDGEDAPKVTVTGKSDDENKADTSVEEEIPADEIADEPTVTADGKEGVKATPGADNDEMTVEYKDEDGKPQSVTVRKDPETGKWAPVLEEGEELPEGVTVDEDNGTVSIDPNSLADPEEGEEAPKVTVTGKSNDETKADTTVEEEIPTDEVADKPAVTAEGKEGVKATPGADNDEMTVAYKDENGDDKTVTVKKDPETGKWSPVLEEGEELPEGVTVDEDNGTVSIDPNGLADPEEGEEAPKVTVTGKSNDETKADTTVEEEIPADEVADKPAVTANGKEGVKATPGADNDEMTVEYKDEDGKPQSVTVRKDPETGKWAPVLEEGEELPEGVTVDEDNGTVSIDPNSLADPEEGEEAPKVTVTGKSNDETKADTTVEEEIPTDEVADKPAVTAEGKEGVKATPGADNDEMTVAYKDENGDDKTVTVKKDPETGKWSPVLEEGEELPEGVTVDEDNGTVSIDPNGLADPEEGEEAPKVTVTGKSNDETKADTTVEEEIPADEVADKPAVTANGKEGVKATPGADNDEMTVAYKDENGDDKTVTVKKDPETGKWSPVLEEGEELPEGVTVDEDNGTVSIDPNSLADPEEGEEAPKVTVTGKSNDETKADTTVEEEIPADEVADKPAVTANGKEGVKATPGADNDEMTVAYKDENGDDKTVTVKKDPETGKWSPVLEEGEELPESVTVDEDNGTVSIEPNGLADPEEGEEAPKVTVTGKSNDETKADTTVEEEIPADEVADKPAVTANGKEGVKATPGADNDEMTVAYKDENGDDKTVTVKKDPETGKWSPVLEDGKELPEGVTVDEDNGTVSIDPNSLADPEEGEEAPKVTVTGKSNDETKADTTVEEEIPTDEVADKPAVTAEGKEGVKATPGADNDEMTVEYKDEDGNDKTVTVKKDPETGKWSPVLEEGEELPESVIVDEDNGTVSIDPNGLADPVDGEDAPKVTVTGKSDDENKADTSVEEEIPADEIADEPTVTADGKEGVKATPGADNDEMTVEYKDEDGKPQSVTVRKDPETGKWSPVLEEGEELPESVTVDEDNGTVSIDPNSLADPEEGEEAPKVTVTGKSDDETKADTSVEEEIPADEVADKPVVEEDGKGGITAKPGTDNDELVVEYVDENLGKQSVKVGKDENGKWVAKEPSELPEGITLDPTTGEVTVPASVLEDGTEVKATGTDTDEPVKAPTEATETAPSIPEVLGVTNNDTDGDGKVDNTDVAVKLPSDAQVGDKVKIKDKAGDVVGEKELTAADIKAGEVTLSVEPLKDGETYDVVVSDSEGNESLPAKVDGDQTPPSDIAPTVESVTNNFDEDGDPVSTDVKVTLPEGVEPGDKVQIKDKDGNVIAEKELTQDDIDNGEVTLTTDEPLANEEPYNVVVTDPTNNSSPATPIKGDTSEPVAPTIDSQDDTKNDAGEPVSTTVKGKAEAGSIVTIYNEAGEPVASETADENGNYEITVAPALDGNYTVTATDEKGNESDATDLDKAAPDAPEITGAYNKDGVTHIKGKTEPGATVKVYDDKGNELGQVVADENGNYDVELNTKLADGQNVDVTATDKAGNESDGSPFIGKEVYPPIIEEVTNNDHGTTTISGTAEPNAKVIVDGVEVTADADGKYTVDVPTKEDGQDYEATATVTNDQGKDVTSEPAKETADTEAPTAPTVAGVTNIDNGSVVTGTAEPGSVVKVIDPDTNEVIGSAVAKEDGSFSVTTNKVLEDKKDYNVTATDEQGNDSNPATATGDTVAPEKPVITDVTNNGDNTTTVKGTAEPGSIVKLTDPDTGKVIGSAKADDSGNYEITAPTLKDGKEYNVTATDDHGNTSDPETVTGDTKAPDAPEITEIDNSDDKSVITGTAEPGSTVSLKDPVTGETIATATADKDGNYTIETDKPLEHDKKYNVTATDDHGNESKPDTFIADTEAPKAPTIDDVTHDENGSTIKGTAEPGSTVAIKDANGDVIASATADKDGNYEITTEKPLEDGTYDVTATDGQGNESDPAETVVDNTAPDAPEVTEANGNTVKGTAEAGSTVVLKDDKGDVIGSAVADEDGNFEITTEEPLKGHYEVTATDKSDNTSEATPIDKSAPDAPTNVTAEKTAEGNTQVSGNAEPGSLVKLKNEQGDEIGSATADENGSFTIDVAGGIEGNFDVTASNPNNGQESAPAELPIDTKAPSAPQLTANDDGSVTLDLPEDANEGDKVTVTMTPQGSDTPVDVEMTKTADGWSSSNEDLIPATAGNSTTIPENKVADKSEVSATASDAAENSNVAEPVEALEPPKGIAKIYDENGNLVEEIDTKDFAKYDASWQRYHKEEQWYTDWNKTINNSNGGVINLNESETRENSQSARGTEWKADHPKALDDDGSWGTTVSSVAAEYISSSASNRIFFKGDKYDAINLGRDRDVDWGAGSVLSDRVGNLKDYDPDGEYDYKESYYDSSAKGTWAKTGATAEMDGYTYDQWSITSNTGVTTSIWIEQSMPVF